MRYVSGTAAIKSIMVNLKNTRVYLAIPARLELATYCLEGRFRTFSDNSVTSVKSSISTKIQSVRHFWSGQLNPAGISRNANHAVHFWYTKIQIGLSGGASKMVLGPAQTSTRKLTSEGRPEGQWMACG